VSDTRPYTPPPSAPQLSHAFGVRPPHLFSCNSTTALFVDGVDVTLSVEEITSEAVSSDRMSESQTVRHARTDGDFCTRTERSVLIHSRRRLLCLTVYIEIRGLKCGRKWSGSPTTALSSV